MNESYIYNLHLYVIVVFLWKMKLHVQKKKLNATWFLNVEDQIAVAALFST